MKKKEWIKGDNPCNSELIDLRSSNTETLQRILLYLYVVPRQGRPKTERITSCEEML